MAEGYDHFSKILPPDVSPLAEAIEHRWVRAKEAGMRDPVIRLFRDRPAEPPYLAPGEPIEYEAMLGQFDDLARGSSVAGSSGLSAYFRAGIRDLACPVMIALLAIDQIVGFQRPDPRLPPGPALADDQAPPGAAIYAMQFGADPDVYVNPRAFHRPDADPDPARAMQIALADAAAIWAQARDGGETDPVVVIKAEPLGGDVPLQCEVVVSDDRKFVAQVVGRRWPRMAGEVLAGARAPGRGATVVVIERDECSVRELLPPDAPGELPVANRPHGPFDALPFALDLDAHGVDHAGPAYRPESRPDVERSMDHAMRCAASIWHHHRDRGMRDAVMLIGVEPPGEDRPMRSVVFCLPDRAAFADLVGRYAPGAADAIRAGEGLEAGPMTVVISAGKCIVQHIDPPAQGV